MKNQLYLKLKNLDLADLKTIEYFFLMRKKVCWIQTDSDLKQKIKEGKK